MFQNIHSSMSKTMVYVIVLSFILMSFGPRTYGQGTDDDPSINKLEQADILLREGIELYKKSDFINSIEKLQTSSTLLEKEIEIINNKKKLISAHLYLGLAYIGIGQNAKAREQFAAVVGLDQNYTLSPKEYSSKIVSLFNEVRAEHVVKILQQQEKEKVQEIPSVIKEPQAAPAEETSQEKPKKKWYKKWWFWGGVGVAMIALASATGSQLEEKDFAISDIQVNPEEETYSIFHEIELKCNLNDPGAQNVTYTWQCDIGGFENIQQEFVTDFKNTVKWAYYWDPDDPLKTAEKIVQKRQTRKLNHPKIEQKAPQRNRKLAINSTLSAAKSYSLLQLFAVNSPGGNTFSSGSQNSLNADEIATITISIMNADGESDNAQIQIPVEYYIPMNRIGLYQGATDLATDYRLKEYTIRIDSGYEYGPFSMNDVGLSRQEKVLEFPDTHVEAMITLKIKGVHDTTSTNVSRIDEDRLLKFAEIALYTPLLGDNELNFSTVMEAGASSTYQDYSPAYLNDFNLETSWAAADPVEHYVFFIYPFNDTSTVKKLIRSLRDRRIIHYPAELAGH